MISGKINIQQKRNSPKKGKVEPSETIEAFNKTDRIEIFMLTSYPPRECGIATYSSDLEKVLIAKFEDCFKIRVCALESNIEFHHYPENIRHSINTDTELDFIKLSRQINTDINCGLVLIQHEFGLFNGNENAFQDFLEFVTKPIIFTFHTVLPNPDLDLRKNVQHMASKSAGIIVMTQNSAKILIDDYGIFPDLITIIPHGTHLVRYESKVALKQKYDLQDRTVLTTFGLLGPGKNIETTLDALPKVISEQPDTIFLIIGKTHPTLVKQKGEDYREFLKYKINKLGLDNHVRFINQFVALPELLEYLQLTDIYLFTSKDPNQAVSGTFSYAMSCGCPIISTPIPHAVEALQNKAGVIFDFENSDQLTAAITYLMQNSHLQERMSLNGLHSTAESAWENAAIAHAELFKKICIKGLDLRYKKPAVSLNHLKKMTSKTGIIQFALINEPDLSSGYTLDDNARALIAVCRHFELTGDPKDLKYIHRYLNFIENCFRPDGKFLNYVDENQCFTSQNDTVNLEDSNGRALWALGYLLSTSSKMPLGNDLSSRNAEYIFLQALETMQNFRSPRALAFMIKGLYYFNIKRTDDNLSRILGLLADRLLEQYHQVATKNWQWFETYLTYGNSVLPEAMLMAYTITGKIAYQSCAKESFDFLLSRIFTGNSIRVVSNLNWMMKGDEVATEFHGGEQPIDVAYTILALKKFHEVFPQAGYDKKMEGAFNWFMGDNALKQTIYNPCTAGCYDGLERHTVNLNQGAESTISYLLARMAFEDE